MDELRSHDREQTERAVASLRVGEVIALPTDTVYGIGASLDHPEAIERIFAIKGREETKAIPLLVSDPGQLARLSEASNPVAEALADAYWPGGLTIVVRASALVPPVVRRGLPTVGVRMPDDRLALAVIAAAGGVLAVTSANRSGEREARSAAEVRAALGDEVACVVDGGPSPIGVASTVVDVTGPEPVILRQGAIAADEIAAVAAHVRRR